ncbi:MAG: cytochrome c oxidase subunit 3 [Bacteroidetes bacterium]|nr:cytochrome c oxidase subunit 3 [Bacteroidota bacterium]MCH8232331.1 cytochrome c oxidase subunit 3 [Bacteroidota bacterium]
MTTTSNLFAAFFYIIIGVHAFHVLVGLSILMYLLGVLRLSFPIESTKDKILACSLYWYFVVAIWPVLYIMVYIL